MNRILTLLSLIVVTNVSMASNNTILNDQSDEKVVMTVGNEQVTLQEFETILRKNNANQQLNQKYLDDYADLFVDFKRKVLYAKENKMDTSTSFKSELAGYRKQLARPYLTDQSAEDELINEAYERMKYEVNASHILISLDANASPEDTLAAYNKINDLRISIVNGQNFSEVAKIHSNDPSAKTNNGNLGYFSAFRMVYLFESMAFNTPVGRVSEPFRTQFGYHILKVNDKRPNRGEVKVAHIMIEERNDATPKELSANQEKLQQLLESLESETTFEEMTKFSDDKGSAKNNGELPWFGTGQMVTEFEQAAFELEAIGEVSKPVKTMYGWHIIKLLDKRGIPSFEDSQAKIKRNIKRDARSNRGVESLIKRIKKEYNFSDYTSRGQKQRSNDFYISRLNHLKFDYEGSESLLEPFCDINYKEWDRLSYKTDGLTMFKLDGISYTQDDFADYLAKNKIKADSANSCQEVHKKYKEWVNKTCLDYEDSQLENKYPEFKALMNEYHDGILLFNLMDEKVWSKAVNDTVGLLNYYNLTKEQYSWDERAEAKVYTSIDESISNRVRSLLNNRFNSSILTAEEFNFMEFGKGEFYLSDERILNLVNRYDANRLKISNKTFSKGDSEALDSHWYKGLTENEQNLDGSIFFADVQKVKTGGLKSYEEARGEVITNYQNYLEEKWVSELEKKYPATINKKVLYSITKD